MDTTDSINTSRVIQHNVTLEKSIKVSDETHRRLENYKEIYGHTSFDSAIREALMDSEAFKDDE